MFYQGLKRCFDEDTIKLVNEFFNQKKIKHFIKYNASNLTHRVKTNSNEEIINNILNLYSKKKQYVKFQKGQTIITNNFCHHFLQSIL